MSQAARRISAGGVYQPRSRGAAMADALADARRSMLRLIQLVVVRGAGLLLLLCGLAALVALLTYDSRDASINNATGDAPANLLGGLGATAADILLQSFGLGAVFVLTPLLTWGFVAMRGHTLRHVFWRGFAWPMGTLLVAAGLGVFPVLHALPAGDGGLIGIAAAKLSAHVGQVYHASWLGIVLPLVLLLTGFPLAFLATGLRLKPVLRGLANIPAGAWWLGTQVKMPRLPRREPSFDYDESDDAEHEQYDESDDADGYGLSVEPEPIAA